ncbi:MAG: response regulator [Pseudomonadota bacterium]
MAKILLIDDMVNVRQAIASILKNNGHDVTEAEEGQKGLALAEQEKFDLVITDIMMPASDGTDIIISLKQKSDAPPVIAISGGGSGIPAETALTIARQKADMCLIKPFENKELIGAVQKLI